MERFRDERGMVGKLAVVWLLIAAVVIVVAIDGASIVITRFHLSNVATDAATDAVADFRLGHDVDKACATAAATVHTQDASLKVGKTFCEVDEQTGSVTITLHEEAKTILLGRLDATKHYAVVTDRETNSPPAV